MTHYSQYGEEVVEYMKSIQYKTFANSFSKRKMNK